MSSKRRKTVAHNNVVELTQALYLNGKAIQEGPKRKTWSRHDLKHIKALTANQEIMIKAFLSGDNVIAHGSPGTGKTYLALYLALNELLRHDTVFDKIIIVRSAVPTRDIGFMPGDLNEKTALYENPYRDIFADLLGRPASYDNMKEAGLVQFVVTSFVRGVTWDNAIVVFDEVQNGTDEEIHSVMTRLGNESRLIVCGDKAQNDLCTKKGAAGSGIQMLLNVTSKMKGVSSVHFTHDDCVRSGFVKEWLFHYEKEVLQ